jgi:biopolymer transport protein ExbD
MPARTSRRLPPNIDLTVMVDIAFLLLMFFMLSGSIWRVHNDLADMPITRSPGPTCTLYTQAPDMFITVTREGRTYIHFSEAAFYNALHTAATRAHLPAISPIGAAIGRRGKELQLPNIQTQTILQHWLQWATTHDDRLQISVIGDADAPYPAMETVFAALQCTGINRLRLITQLERDPLLSRL